MPGRTVSKLVSVLVVSPSCKSPSYHARLQVPERNTPTAQLVTDVIVASVSCSSFGSYWLRVHPAIQTLTSKWKVLELGRSKQLETSPSLTPTPLPGFPLPTAEGNASQTPTFTGTFTGWTVSWLHWRFLHFHSPVAGQTSQAEGWDRKPLEDLLKYCSALFSMIFSCD